MSSARTTNGAIVQRGTRVLPDMMVAYAPCLSRVGNGGAAVCQWKHPGASLTAWATMRRAFLTVTCAPS